jgi:hypothetical protein
MIREIEDWVAFNAAGGAYAIGSAEIDPDGKEFRELLGHEPHRVERMPVSKACGLHLAYLSVSPAFREVIPHGTE